MESGSVKESEECEDIEGIDGPPEGSEARQIPVVHKRLETINTFLGTGKQYHVPLVVRPMYGYLLALALQRHI